MKETDFLLIGESHKEKNSVTLCHMGMEKTAVCRPSSANITEEVNTLGFFFILKITLYDIINRIASYKHKKQQ